MYGRHSGLFGSSLGFGISNPVKRIGTALARINSASMRTLMEAPHNTSPPRRGDSLARVSPSARDRRQPAWLLATVRIALDETPHLFDDGDEWPSLAPADFRYISSKTRAVRARRKTEGGDIHETANCRGRIGCFTRLVLRDRTGDAPSCDRAR